MPNKPHRGQGQWGRPNRQSGAATKAQPKHAQRVGTAGRDSKGYQTTGRVRNPDVAGRAPKVPREAGHYHPIGKGSSRGLMGDISETRHHNANQHSTRSIGKHTGPAPKLDQSKRRGAEGNSQGSAPPGFDKSGGGRKGTLASHLGTAGRGGKGALTQIHSNQLSESPTHEWWEKLGST